MPNHQAPHTRQNHPSRDQQPRAISLMLTRANHIDPALLIGSVLVGVAVIFTLLLF